MNSTNPSRKKNRNKSKITPEQTFTDLETPESIWIRNNIRINNEPTDAYGELEFVGSSGNRAKYIRVAADTPEKTLFQLMTTVWKLKEPNIIISVTGGAKNFKMRFRLTKEFRQSLIKAAVSTGAWIVTGGTHAGVMKHVGNAVHNHITAKSSKLVALGIATWGIVHDNDGLKISNRRRKSEPVQYEYGYATSLDRNHTHFLLVDDGSTKKFGREIELRAKLESYIATQVAGKSVQVVCVIVQGGPGSLKTVYNALTQGTPVVVVGDSGGWANILATIHSESYSAITESLISELLSDQGTNNVEPKSLSDWTNMARECVKRKNLITVFSLDIPDNIHDLDIAILEAVLSANCDNTDNNTEEHLKLALAWNRSDIAQSHILTDDADIPMHVLSHLFTRAVREDKHAFMKLFLDYGLQLHDHFTFGELLRLYQCMPKNSILSTLLKKETVACELGDVIKIMRSLMGPLFQSHHVSLEIDKKFASSQSVVRELFLWCILLNKKESAKVLWETMTEDELPACVVANRLLTSLAKKSSLKEEKDDLIAHAQEYKEISYGILTECYDKDAEKTTKLLKRRLCNWGELTCLQIAVDTEDFEFISHAAVQNLLDNIWLGDIIKTKRANNLWFAFKIFMIAFLPFLIPFVMDFKDVRINPSASGDVDHTYNSYAVTSVSTDTVVNVQLKDGKHGKLQQSNSLQKILSFYGSPIVKFHLTVLFYLAFLILFAYILLFNFHDVVTPFEFALVAWVIVLLFDEGRQMLEVRIEGLTRKIKHWINHFENKLDLLSLVLFFLGFGLRFSHLEVARILLAVSFIIYCLRLLGMFTVHEQLGPKLLMMGRMLEDLFFFIFILLVFLIAYGVASQALLYPNETDAGNVFAGILSKPYWNIFGELFLPEIVYNPTADEFTCTNDTALIAAGHRRCPTITESAYLLLANVLLLNLLIAMFSYTFDKLVNNTHTIWRYQRFELINEYYNRPAFVVPFSILSYIASFSWFCKAKVNDTNAFEESFEPDELLSLTLWESSNKDVFMAELRSKNKETVSTRVQGISERLETLVGTMDSVSENLTYQKKIGKRVKALEGKLNTSYESLQWIMSALKDNNTVPKEMPIPVHVNARKELYPGSSVTRFRLTDHMVPWNVPMIEYAPSSYTAQVVRDCPVWADVDLESGKMSTVSTLPYNKFDDDKKVDRTSYLGSYEVINGLPRNPKGRTGMTGRGLLGRYGPNHAADPIVTRWERDAQKQIVKIDGKPLLQFIAVRRADTNDWAIPGGMVDPGENVSATLKREFTEEVLSSDDSMSDEDAHAIHHKIDELFRSGGVEVYRGYSDDHRNTDNAWIETLALNFHDDDGSVFNNVKLHPGEEAAGVKWQRVEKTLQLFANHETLIKNVAKLHNSYF